MPASLLPAASPVATCGHITHICIECHIHQHVHFTTYFDRKSAANVCSNVSQAFATHNVACRHRPRQHLCASCQGNSAFGALQNVNSKPLSKMRDEHIGEDGAGQVWIDMESRCSAFFYQKLAHHTSQCVPVLLSLFITLKSYHHQHLVVILQACTALQS